MAIMKLAFVFGKHVHHIVDKDKSDNVQYDSNQ